MAGQERWVDLHQGLDPVLLQAWRELLDEEGIPAQIPGLRDGQTLGGMFGSTGVGVEVRVRQSDVARACELLASLTTGRAIARSPEPTIAGEGPYRSAASTSDAVAEERPAPRLAGQIIAALLLSLVEMFAFRMLIGGELSAGLLLVVVVGIDLATGRTGKDLPRKIGRAVAGASAALSVIALFARGCG